MMKRFIDEVKVKIEQNDALSCLLENLNKELIKIIPKAKGILL